MMFRVTGNKIVNRGLVPALAMAGMLAVAGCATNQPYGRGNSGGYGTTYGNGYDNSSQACRQCGTVQSVRQVYIQDGKDSNVLGTIIGAVAGGLLGNTIGKGDGRKAATVAGAVAGGAVGHHVGKGNDRGGSTGYRVVVQLDDGRMATVTQRGNPGVQRGDRVQVRNDHVYAR